MLTFSLAYLGTSWKKPVSVEKKNTTNDVSASHFDSSQYFYLIMSFKI